MFFSKAPAVNSELHDADVDTVLIGAASNFDADLDRTEVSRCDISLLIDKSVNTIKIPKCKGYIPVITGDIYENFPFHMIKNLNVVFEFGVFHSHGCMNNGYRLFDHVVGPLNEICNQLRSYEKLRKIINQANDTQIHLSKVNHENLSCGLMVNSLKEQDKSQKISPKKR